jgi:hypothetical protein
MMGAAHPHAVEGDVAAFNEPSQSSGEQSSWQELLRRSAKVFEADSGQVGICAMERVEARKDL